MAITRINHFQAKAGKGDLLFQKMKNLIPMISGFEGCTSCEVVREVDDDNHIVILEGWASVDHHKAALAEVPAETFEPVMALLDGPPSGSYFTK